MIDNSSRYSELFLIFFLRISIQNKKKNVELGNSLCNTLCRVCSVYSIAQFGIVSGPLWFTKSNYWHLSKENIK